MIFSLFFVRKFCNLKGIFALLGVIFKSLCVGALSLQAGVATREQGQVHLLEQGRPGLEYREEGLPHLGQSLAPQWAGQSGALAG